MALASETRGPRSTADDRARPSPVGASTLPAAAFQASRMVRFSDCDPAGIVYTPRYVDMLNGVIEDFFPAALGLDYHGFITAGIGLGYASLQCDFFQPARMGEVLSIAPLVDRIGGASAGFVLHAHRGEGEVFRGRLTMVTTDIEAGRPIPLPAPIRAALTRYQEQCQ